MWKRIFGSGLLVMLLTGCATTGPAIDLGCWWTEYIRIDRQHDQLTEETARQILAHNLARKAQCEGL